MLAVRPAALGGLAVEHRQKTILVRRLIHCCPCELRLVGKKSAMSISASVRLPGSIIEGQFTISGTRVPVSSSRPLPPWMRLPANWEKTGTRMSFPFT